MSLARGHLQETLVQSYPVIVCSDAGKLASTGGNEQCRSALLQHCRREIMSYSKMYVFFFNLDKNTHTRQVGTLPAITCRLVCGLTSPLPELLLLSPVTQRQEKAEKENE